MNRLKRSAALLLAALTVLSMSGMTAFAEAGLPEPTAAAENGCGWHTGAKTHTAAGEPTCRPGCGGPER